MMRLLLFICAVTVLDFAASGIFVEGFGISRNPSRKLNNTRSTCTEIDALMYSHEFHNCFIDRKYKDSGQDLENIVDRILEHASVCVRNSGRNCRPDYKGFMVIMDRVITQMKDYSYIYLELISHGRNKIKDLDCVETSLSNETYQSCFHDMFKERYYPSEEKFQQKVEKAISCTNKSNKKCSRAAKTSLNKMVRTVLSVPQPKREDIEDEEKPKPKQWQWYDYIIQPFVSMWNAIRSFFGF